MPTTKMLLGAHVSIAGGFDQAIERGEKIGATCIQIFTKSNRQWNSKPITPQDVSDFLTAQKNSSIKQVVAHASYLINLSSATAATRDKSQGALIDELQRCEMLQIPYLVLHPGTYPTKDHNSATLKEIAQSINHIFAAVKPKHTTLLLETMAGQGSVVGSTLQELAQILEHVHNKKHIGLCLDTCHLFAAGFNVVDKKTYQELWHAIENTCGVNIVKVIHVNDSKKECGSHVDRHEHIGHGKINPEFFRLLMNDTKLHDVAKILETPKDGDDETRSDKENLEKLKSYLK